MAKAAPIRGHIVQYERPYWAPLAHLLGEELPSWFMWMCEVELADQTRIHAYKHRTTRRYLHLDANGRAFHYDERSGYAPVAAPIAIVRVFVGWERSMPADGDVAALQAALRQVRG